MSAGEVLVLLASAGTGKTTRLTDRLLALYFGGAAPEEVLASTFTRKAAGEIFRRLLSRLAKAARDEAAARKLAEDIGRPDLTRGDCGAKLVELARGIQRVRVSTLDALFVRLARAYGFDLGLPPAWRIGEVSAEAALREAVIARVFAQASRDELATLFDDLQREASRGVYGAIEQTVEQGVALALDSDARAWDALRPGEPMSDEQLALHESALAEVDVPTTREGKPRPHWDNGVRALREAVAQRDWEALVHDCSLVVRVGERATHFDRVPIEPELAELLIALARHASAALVAKLAAQNRATRRLLDRAIAAEAELRFESRRYGFDAPPRMLAGAGELAIESDPRAGAATAHLLLDEFQDTSAVQWRVLRPVVERLRARAGASFFCVGDAKQSIYVWRDAEPELLLGLPSDLGVEPEPLPTNWRSSPAVVRAVNQVFGGFAANPAFGEPKRQLEREVAARFSSEYQALEPGRDHPGAVRLSCAPAADDDARFPEQPAMDLAVELAAQHLAADPSRSIAILLRRNRFVAYLLQRLAERGIHASGEGGKPLTDSNAVNAALSVLELADHPADTLAQFHVATSVFGPRLGVPVDPASDASAAASRIRADLFRRGAAVVLEELADAAASELGPFERRRMRQLVDLATRLQAERGLRPAQLAARLAATNVEDPRAAAVRVMTVHKAKGLEFDVVILPELDGPLLGKSKPWIARRPGGEPAAPFEAVSRSATKELRAWVPALDELYRADRRRHVREALCALYVAMTRAVHALELVVAASDKPPGASFAGILRGAFGDTAAPGSPLWVEQHGVLPNAPARAREAPAEVEAAAPIVFAPSAVAREWTRRSPSSLEGGGLVVVADRLADKRAAFTRGSRVHAWLEAIAWIEDGAPDRAQLDVLARRGALGGPALAEEVDAFLRRLALPSLRAELSRAEAAKRLGARGEELELWRERRFALPIDAGGRRELLHGAFDRAVVARRAGVATAAELVDFKTDALNGSRELLRARTEHYRPQIESYRAALARMLGLAPERIGARLVFLDPGARDPSVVVL